MTASVAWVAAPARELASAWVSLGVVLRATVASQWRQRADLAAAWCFFLVVAALFPLAVGPEPQLLQRMGPGVIWVAAVLATLGTLPRWFHDDWQDGTLEQMVLSPHPLALLMLVKVATHGALALLPLVALSPLLAVPYGLSASALVVLVAGLLLGLPVLCLLGAVAAALVLGVRSGAVLLALLVLPLTVPLLVLGAGAVGQPPEVVAAHLSLLAAMALLAVVGLPWAVASAVRMAVEG
jgi:heme exporter protein B